MKDEVTLQHCLRFPNSFLKSGLSYRETLAKKFLPLIENNSTVLEIGAGLGHLAQGLLRFWKSKDKTVRYKIIDLSQRLIERQKKETAGFDMEFIHGDALKIPIEDESVDFLICNEVIADLVQIGGNLTQAL